MYASMIVEDEELIRQGLTSLVDYEQFGMTVINQAENGREAWEKFKEQPADILLTDINMPQMNGFFQVCRITMTDQIFDFRLFSLLIEFSLHLC